MGLTPADGPYRRGKGCDACWNTGYKGRMGLYEVLEVDDNRLRQLIAQQAQPESLWDATFGYKGASLRDDAREKVRQGLTTIEEVNWALFDYPFPPRA